MPKNPAERRSSAPALTQAAPQPVEQHAAGKAAEDGQRQSERQRPVALAHRHPDRDQQAVGGQDRQQPLEQGDAEQAGEAAGGEPGHQVSKRIHGRLQSAS
jgi:hypothetical protein